MQASSHDIALKQLQSQLAAAEQRAEEHWKWTANTRGEDEEILQRKRKEGGSASRASQRIPSDLHSTLKHTQFYRKNKSQNQLTASPPPPPAPPLSDADEAAVEAPPKNRVGVSIACRKPAPAASAAPTVRARMPPSTSLTCLWQASSQTVVEACVRGGGSFGGGVCS